MKDSTDNHYLRLASEEPLRFTEEELGEIRKTRLYGTIEDKPTEVILFLCSLVALGRAHPYVRTQLRQRYALDISKRVYNYLRLKEPFLTIVRRFKDVLESRIEYIPIYSKQVRLRELQKALNDAKQIEAADLRVKAIVDVLKVAQQMTEGKKVMKTHKHEGGLNIYHQIIAIGNKIQNKSGSTMLPENREVLSASLSERLAHIPEVIDDTRTTGAP